MENSSINVNFEPVENEKDQEAVIEAVLFTIGGAVELRQLAAAIGQDKETAKRAVERLAKRYREETRGMEIKQLEDSYQMCTKAAYYENLIRVINDPDVLAPLKFLRAREIVHFQRFGEALEKVKEKLDPSNYYYFNPEFDKKILKS